MITLYQFPISHYCEKVRWALDYKDLEHKKVNLLPGLHIKTTKKLAKYSSVPVLTDGEVVLQNSSKIITYLDENYPEKSLTPSDEIIRLEALDFEKFVDAEIGVHVRVCCYHILLEHPEIVIPFFAHKGPWYGSVLMKLGFSKLKVKMRKMMNINAASFAESKAILNNGVDKIYRHLQNNDFLAGKAFSRADLAAASLLAPLVMPDGYGLNWPKKIPPDLQDLMDEFKDRTLWVKEIYRNYRMFDDAFL
jgi:glutathione S-transferase